MFVISLFAMLSNSNNLFYHTDSYATIATNYNLTTLLTQTIVSGNEIYDSRITRPFALLYLFTGSIGNSLSFIVFIQPQLRIRSTFRYLAYLSIVDLTVLYLGLGYIVLRDYFLFDIRKQNLLLCKFHTFLTYATTHASSWILTVVSIDRAMASTVSKINKPFCRTKSVDRIILSMFIIISLINSHILLFMGEKRRIIHTSINNISSYQDIVVCTHNTSKTYFQFFEKPYNIFDLLCYVFIPFLIMTICTGIITYRLFSLRKTTLTRRVNGRMCTGTNRARQIFYMLLTLNLVFIVFLAPTAAGQIFQDLNKEYQYRSYNSVALVLTYSNYALNFVLYGVASSQFRLTLRQLLRGSNNDLIQRHIPRFGVCTTGGL